MSNWISVDDSLPEVNVHVLVVVKYDDEPFIASLRHPRRGNPRWFSELPDYGNIEGDAYWDGDFTNTVTQVTHWRPLPMAPPNEL